MRDSGNMVCFRKVRNPDDDKLRTTMRLTCGYLGHYPAITMPHILNDQSKLPDIELNESAHAVVHNSMSLLNHRGTCAILSSLSKRLCPDWTTICGKQLTYKILVNI